MTDLRISPDLSLPLTAVTGKHALLGSSGAGKSNAGVVLAEAMYDADLIFVAIDPKGDWWGLRYGADRKTAGLEVPVFGGLHGDDGLQLDPASGSFIASLIVERRLRCVLDLSEMTKGEQTRFLADFAERLFRLKNAERFPIHLFLDEVDEYLPQKIVKSEGHAARCLGLWSRIVKQGRNRGIGITLMSQRSAVVNKDVLTQTETLIALRTTAPQDRAAIRAWVEHHALGKDLVNALPELENGEAWVWSPHAYKLMVNVQFARRRTFDSGATPELGEDLEPPGRLADVDIAALKEQMAETVARAKADDPKELRKEISTLRRKVTELEAREPTAADPVEVEVRVPFVPDEVVGGLGRINDGLLATARDLEELVGLVEGLEDRPGGATPAGPAPRPARTPRAVAAASAPASRPTRPTPPADVDAGDVTISGPQRNILNALAWFENVGIDRPPVAQVAFIAGASPTSSSYSNNRGTLRSAGLIDYPAGGHVALTDAGRAIAVVDAKITTTEELLVELERRLGKPKGRILRALADAWPDPIDRDELADLVEASATSSSYSNNLGNLRTLGFIDYPERGYVAATDLLFIRGVR